MYFSRVFLISLIIASISPSLAEEASSDDDKGKALGSEETVTAIRVVKDRFYKKAQHLDIGIFGGITSTDPFIVSRQYGLHLGYYLSERIGLRVFGWQYYEKRSSAHDEFDRQTAKEQFLRTNYHKYFYAGEFLFSPLYGKFSLMGNKIIYYDFLIHGGTGLIKTDWGKYQAWTVGLSQYIYLTKSLALTFSFRYLTFPEQYQDKSRRRNDGAINLGFSYLL